MKILINYKIADKFRELTGIDTISLKPYKKLDVPVASHPDMLFCVLDDVVFCYEDYVKEFDILDTINAEGYRIVYVSNECEKDYPKDISLNVLVMGKTLFCNGKYTAKEILDYANENGYDVINVNQGYSACSTLVVNENNAITTDEGMKKSILNAGKNAILIKNDGIILEGYNCGFIGGATAVIDRKIYLFGKIDCLVDGEVINEFIHSCGSEFFSISLDGVYDFGGIKLLKS